MNKEEELADKYAEEYVMREDAITENDRVPFDNGYGFQTVSFEDEVKKGFKDGFLTGLKTGKPKWHKVFTEGKPYSFEYWDIPQDNLPKVQNFYFVKLKNGYVKICELKYDQWSKKKKFYDLHGGTQSDVAEWLDYPNVTDKD